MEKHVILGLFIPVIFFVFTGMVKSLVLKEWLWSSFYLGIDISLAALANGIVNVVEGAHAAEGHAVSADMGIQMYYSAICIIVAIGALFSVMGLHQKFEIPPTVQNNRRLLRGIMLGVVSNLISGAVFAMFIYLKLQGKV